MVPSNAILAAIDERVAGLDPKLLWPVGQRKFTKIIREIRRDAGDAGPLAGLDSADLSLLAAFSVLTADFRGASSRLQHCQAVAGLFGAVTCDRQRARIAVECTIAYGCGWGRGLRALPAEGGNADDRLAATWDWAYHLLREQIKDGVAVGTDLIRRILRPFVKNSHDEQQLVSELEAEGWRIAELLTVRLVYPTKTHHLKLGFQIRGHVGQIDGNILRDAPECDFTRISWGETALYALPAGSRYTFGVPSGIATATHGGRILAASPGRRFVVRAVDFGNVEVSFPVGLDLGRLLRVEDHEPVMVSVDTVDQWECGCGTWACVERHRIASWTPHPDIELKDFLNSAINGRTYPLTPKSFADGMYYALLSREGWSGDLSKERPPLPRIRRVLMVRRQTIIDPQTQQLQTFEDLHANLILISNFGNLAPVRVVRCPDCDFFRNADDKPCENCESTPLDWEKPVVVWKPVPRLAGPPNPPPAGTPSGQGPDGGNGPADQGETDGGQLETALQAYLRKWKKALESQWREVADMKVDSKQDPKSIAKKVADWKAQYAAYKDSLEAMWRSDADAAVGRIKYANEMGWPIPKVDV